jgi:hypothetical protein
MKNFSALLCLLLFALVVAPGVGAVPINRSDFSSSAIDFDFSSSTSSDFNISGGSFSPGVYKTYGTITIDFTMPVSAVGMDVTRTKSQPIEMSLYDSSDIILENYTWNDTRPFFIGLNNVTSEIAYVEIFSNKDDLDIDNLIYQSDIQSSPVPEPATITMVLLGTGILGFTGFKRKFKK